MAEIQVVFHKRLGDSNDAVNLSAEVLEELRQAIGADLTYGWTVGQVGRIDGDASPLLVTLLHDSAAVSDAVRDRLPRSGDHSLLLWDAAGYLSPGDTTFSGAGEVAPTPLSLPLPPDLPKSLQTPEPAQMRSAAIWSVVISVLVAVPLGLLTPAGSAVRQMFDPRTPSAAVPTAILCMFVWGILNGLNRRRRFTAVSSIDGAALLTAVTSGLKSHGVQGVYDAARGEIADQSPMLRRIRVVLEQWLLRPSAANADFALEQQVLADQEATQRGFVLLRIFVWATPVLGLIGTVIGISLAVGNFAHFLSTNVEDVTKIKEGLVGVTGGLSFAFLITLEGLLSSLMLMLFTSNLQTREERFFAETDRSIAEVFLPELQRVSPERDSGVSVVDPEKWSEAMTKATQKVMDVIDAAGQNLLKRWDERHTSYMAQLKDVRTSVEQSAEQVAKELKSASTAIGEHLARTVSSNKALLEAMLEGARKSVEGFTVELNSSTKIVTASMSQAGAETGTHLRSVADALNHAASNHRAVTQQAFADSQSILAGHSASIEHATEAVRALGKLTSQVLESQVVLQAAMAQLGDSKLANLLAELDASLKDLKPLLTNLSQPFVLQAVPVGRGPQQTDQY